MSDEHPVPQKAQLSRDATPFIPSYMRTAGATCPPASSIAAAETVSTPAHVVGNPNRETHQGEDASPVTSWGQYIAAMQEVEIEMLIDMMPAEVQMTYNEALHRANKAANASQSGGQASPQGSTNARETEQGTYQSAPSAEERRRRSVEAATATFSGLSDDQLYFLEEFLHEDNSEQAGNGTSRLEPLLEGADMFMNGDEDMNSEEEEWLLEQMMGPVASAVATASAGKPQTRLGKPTKRMKNKKK